MTRSPTARSATLDAEAPLGRGADLRFVALVSIGLLILTSLPYLYGYLAAPSGKQFMGILLDVPDHAQYFSWMRELSQANLASNKLTSEPNEPVFFNLLWWILGRFGRLLGVGYDVPFQLLRIASVILFSFFVYWWCRSYYPNRLGVRVSLLGVMFTSGLGWVLVVLKYTLAKGDLLFPLDLYVAEGNTFLCAMGYPHFIAAALHIGVFALFLRALATRRWRYTVAGGALALFLGWQHAYDLALVYGVLGVYVLFLAARDRAIPWRAVWASVVIGAISVWPAIYSVLLTSLSPIWKDVLSQYVNAGVFTPNLLHLPILMGLSLLLAVFGEVKGGLFRLKDLGDTELFVKVWFWANLLIIYIPVDYQIHMLNGWQVPMVILAVSALFRHVAPWAQRIIQRAGWRISPAGVRRLVCAAFLIAIVPTNLYLWAWRFVDLARGDYPYYLHDDELAAMAWLEAHGGPDDVVLSSEMIGQYIPMLTGKRAFLAHWAQTVDYLDKRKRVSYFYDIANSDLQRLWTVQDYDIRYVFYSPAEQRLGDYDPVGSGLFTKVFDADRADVFATGEP